MRGYSLRSAYPLARSSQARRRLMLLYNLNATPTELEEPVSSAPPAPHAWDIDTAADDLRRLYVEESPADFPTDPEPEDEFAKTDAFWDDVFRQSELRNEALSSGQVSESVLDEEEDESAAPADESILSSLNEESLILSGQDEESRILSMADLDEAPPEELPGSQTPEDRKPHYPSWYVPNFKTVKRLLDGDKPVTWMFAGESAVSAADLAQGRRNFTDHFSERIRTELGRMLDVVINTGNTGETAANLLKNIEWRVLRFHPEVVQVLLGRNDAVKGAAGREAFQNSLEQIVQIIRDGGAILVLQTPNRVDLSKAEHLADLRSYVRIIRDVARAYNVPLVDHWEHWKAQKPDPESLKTWLAADGQLPGVYGQRELAKLIFRHFEIFDPNSPICSARVP